MSKIDNVLEEFRKTFPQKFVERRAYAENFDPAKHSFYTHDPETQFLSVLLTGYFTDFYYMDAKEVLMYSLPLHKEILKKDVKFYLSALETARECGMKDQVLLGLCLLSRKAEKLDKELKERYVKLLNSFPPNQVVKKFVNAKRKAKIGGGFVEKDKQILEEYLQNQFASEYKTLKYRKYLKQMVNLVHYKNAPKLLFKRLSKYKGSDYIENVKKVVLNSEFPDFEGEKMPFELVRSSIPKHLWSRWIVKNTDMTGHTLLLQAVSLYSALKDISIFDKIVNTPYITSDQILKVAVAAELNNMPDLAKKFAELYAEKVSTCYKELLLPLKEPNVILLLDGSGSMIPTSLTGMFFKSLAVVSPLAPLIKKLVLFSDNAKYVDPKLLLSYDGLRELMKIAPSSGTNIAEALELAWKSEEEVVILVTDEQSNILTSESYEMTLIKRLLDEGKTVIVINPTPYPVSVTDIKDKRIIYVRANNPESLVNAIKLIQMRLSKMSAQELIKEIKVKKRKKKKYEQ